MKNNILYITIALSCVFAGWSLKAGAQELQGEDFSTRALPNAAHALQGAVTGLGVSFESGSPFAASELSLRGLVSSKGIAPLVLVDGVEMSLDDINPIDIEKITVLKDASAYAMYGARAAGGAVLVTLKKGLAAKEFAQEVSVNLFTGVSTPAQTSTMMGDALYRKASLTHNYNVSAKGGNDVFNYYVGGRFFSKEPSFAKNLNSKADNNFNLAGRFDARITKWLRYDFTLDYAYRHDILPYHLTDSEIYLGVVGDNQDEYMDYLEAGLGTTDYSAQHFVMKNGLKASILKGLSLEASYSFLHHYDFDRLRSSNVEGVSDKIAENVYYEDRYRTRNNYFDAGIDYEHAFGCGLNLAAKAGYDYMDSDYHFVDFGVGNLIDPSISTLTAGDGKYLIDAKDLSRAEMGGFVKLALDYDRKVFIDGTFRVDASSKLPSDIACSGAAKVAYDALAGTGKGKLLVSYSFGSVVSAENIGVYEALSTINQGTADGWLFSRKGFSPATTLKRKTPDGLTWERVNTHNVGVEGLLLGDRLKFAVDGFYRNTTEINNVQYRTLGYEISLGWKDKVSAGKHDLRYAVNASLADYSSKITDGMLPVEPRYIYSLDGRLGWAGIDFAFLFQGVGRMEWSQNLNPQWDTLFFNDKASAAWFKLRTITAGYTFSFKKDISLRLGIDGENLFYVSPFKKFTTDIDPELAFGPASLFQNQRAVLFNVKLNF